MKPKVIKQLEELFEFYKYYITNEINTLDNCIETLENLYRLLSDKLKDGNSETLNIINDKKIQIENLKSRVKILMSTIYGTNSINDTTENNKSENLEDNIHS